MGLLINQGFRCEDMRGIDLNPRVVTLNEKIQNCIFERRSLLETGYSEGIFDAVVCLDVLEHIRDVGDALAEFRRILAERGHLITSEPSESVLYRLLRLILKGTYSHESGPGAGKHYYNAQQIDRIIRGAGFVRIASRKLPWLPPFDLFHINLYRKV